MGNSPLYSGIKSFIKFGDVDVLVKDQETKISTIEKYENIKGVLELLLNNKQMDYFRTNILSNETVFIDFNRNKILRVKPKKVVDEINKQLSVEYIQELMDDNEIIPHLINI